MTRRQAVTAGIAGLGTMVFAASARPAISAARPNRAFRVPAGAVDCHVHSFPDPVRFPMAEGRTYTPPPATAEDLCAFHKALGIDRTVVVTPTVYGTDNRATRDTIARLGPKAARGVAVIGQEADQRHIESLDQAGFRGARINIGIAPGADREALRQRLMQTAEQIARQGWHIQLYASLPVVLDISDLIATSPVPVVLDHFAGLNARADGNAAGFGQLLSLLKSGKIWIKLSGAYFVADPRNGYSDVKPYARALAAANADRLLWGSDWPHPGWEAAAVLDRSDGANPRQRVLDDAKLLDLLTDWVPERATRHRILVDNPARLYGFG